MSAMGSSAQEDSSLNKARALCFVVGLDHSSTVFIWYGRCIGIISWQIDHLVAGIAMYICVTMGQKLGQQLLHQKFHQRNAAMMGLVHV